MRLLQIILAIILCTLSGEIAAAGKGASAQSTANILAEANAAGYTLKLIADREEFSLEEPFHLTIRIDGPAGSELSSMEFPLDRLQAFEVKELPGPPGASDKAAPFLYEKRLQLDPWIAETYDVPAVTAEVLDADGHPHRLSTETVTLAVSQPDETYWKTLDISSEERLKRSLTPGADRRNRLIACITAILLTAVGLLLLRAWRKRRRAIAARVPEVPPYEQASAALEALLRQELLRQGETKRYYTGLSDILRRYIERRFALSAPRQTTQEFIAEVASGDRSALKQYAALLREFLLACDMVKFAKATPMADEGEAAAKTCRDFLEATRPAPEAEAPANHDSSLNP